MHKIVKIQWKIKERTKTLKLNGKSKNIPNHENSMEKFAH